MYYIISLLHVWIGGWQQTNFNTFSIPLLLLVWYWCNSKQKPFLLEKSGRWLQIEFRWNVCWKVSLVAQNGIHWRRRHVFVEANADPIYWITNGSLPVTWGTNWCDSTHISCDLILPNGLHEISIWCSGILILLTNDPILYLQDLFLIHSLIAKNCFIMFSIYRFVI